MSKCYFCRTEQELFICENCQKNRQTNDKRRRGLTEWEEMKLGFYRSEKKWIDNIKSRQIVYDKHDRQTVVLTDGKGNIKRAMPRY